MYVTNLVELTNIMKQMNESNLNEHLGFSTLDATNALCIIGCWFGQEVGIFAMPTNHFLVTKMWTEWYRRSSLSCSVSAREILCMQTYPSWRYISSGVAAISLCKRVFKFCSACETLHHFLYVFFSVVYGGVSKSGYSQLCGNILLRYLFALPY